MSNNNHFQVAGLEWADEIDEELKKRMAEVQLLK